MALSMKKPTETNAQTQDTQAKAKAEAAVDATTPKYDADILGSKSGAIAFVAPLGDPSHPDVTSTTKPDGTVEKTTTPYIVGYRFKALEDIEVPDCGLAEDAKKNLMSYDASKVNNKRLVKAGETFDLTRFEMALLLAAPEYNARVNGEGKGFTVAYQKNAVRSRKGTLGETSAATEVPTASLKADSGSIKDYQIIEVLTCEVKKLDNGVTRKERKIVAGFEKWEPLCIAQAPRTRSSSASTPKNRRNAGAEAFLQIVAKRG